MAQQEHEDEEELGILVAGCILIHPKIGKIGRDYFSVQKKMAEKCVNRDDKIPWKKYVNHKNVVNLVTKQHISYVCLWEKTGIVVS